MNRFKKTVSLLVIFLLCALSLIGCQSKKTMFDVMKEAQEITSAKVNMNLTMEVPNSEDFRNLVNSLEEKVLATTSCNLSNEPAVKNYLEAKEKFENVAIATYLIPPAVVY